MSFSLEIKKKIVSKEELTSKLLLERIHSKKIVFTNGCFDLLHLGHVDYLAKARDLADVLVVGVNSDSSVRNLKGADRPIQDEKSRCMILASLVFVDYVVLFDEPTPYNLIKLVQPDVLVKGSDYKKEDIVGYDIVSSRGGRVETIDFVEGYSTTRIVNKILGIKN